MEAEAQHRHNPLEEAYEQTSDFLNWLGSLVHLGWQTLVEAFRPPLRIKLILEQMEFLGLHSLPIVFLVAIFSGLVLVLQTGVQLSRFGAESYAAGIAVMALSREIVPVMGALVLAGRITAGIAAELGTMKVTEQIDALRSMGTDPVSYLVLPRTVATFIMLPLMTTIAIALGIVAGVVVGMTKLNLSASQYFNIAFSWLSQSDFSTGIGKTFFFAIIIAVVGCHEGLQTKGGAAGVGRATTKAVVSASVIILVINYFLTEWFVILFGAGGAFG